MRHPDTIPCRAFVVAEQDDTGTILNDEVERRLVVMSTTNGGTSSELVLRVEGALTDSRPRFAYRQSSSPI